MGAVAITPEGVTGDEAEVEVVAEGEGGDVVDGVMLWTCQSNPPKDCLLSCAGLPRPSIVCREVHWTCSKPSGLTSTWISPVYHE